jgi:hypothetical protein
MWQRRINSIEQRTPDPFSYWVTQKPRITQDVYGHLIPSKQEGAAQLMDDLMFAG